MACLAKDVLCLHDIQPLARCHTVSFQSGRVPLLTNTMSGCYEYWLVPFGAVEIGHLAFRSPSHRFVKIRAHVASWMHFCFFNMTTFLNWRKISLTGWVAWTKVTTALLLPTYLLPNDIHIVTPAQSLPKWRPFGYNRESKDIMRNKKNPTIKSAIRFYNTHRMTSMTVFVSCWSSLWPVVLSARRTSDMSLFSPSRFFCCYPRLLRENITIGLPVFEPMTSNVRWWRAHSVTYHRDNSTLPTPCACPSIWRDVKDLEGIGEIAWGGLDNDQDIAGNMGCSSELASRSMRWRSGMEECHNSLCIDCKP
ncbi:hypothetical protein Hypma_012785 [Hypsizygus marmoreus]|uniref:Uncharacterized protein n=1 Tax=Hypsizygus marmoreus TaxID=39966 RepID=A0A369JFX4_HYPMA|nr:hypothetical protein Hypma_012785 [Hypsizygus marmoreus]